MKQLFFLLLMLMVPLLTQGKTDEKKLLERIDYMIDNDQHYQDIKEKELKHLKQQALDAEDNKTRLLFLDSIYRAYSAYRYDSAYAYMKRGLELAEKCKDSYYITLNQINQASVLSVRGFYSKAEVLLQTLNPETMPYKLKLYYYFTFITGNHTPRIPTSPQNSAPKRSITWISCSRISKKIEKTPSTTIIC